jgi:tetratricopeptide (TPR) repeat protein
LAVSLTYLALLYANQAQYAKSEPLYKRVLAIHEKAFGPHHPDVAKSLENLADLYRKTDRQSQAVEIEERAAAIRAKQR